MTRVHQFSIRVSDSIELRQLAEKDVVELTELIDRNRQYLREWLPWRDNSTSITDTARFIGRSMEQAEDDNGLTLGILFQGKLAGVIGAPQRQ